MQSSVIEGAKQNSDPRAASLVSGEQPSRGPDPHSSTSFPPPGWKIPAQLEAHQGLEGGPALPALSQVLLDHVLSKQVAHQCCREAAWDPKSRCVHTHICVSDRSALWTSCILLFFLLTAKGQNS